MNARLQQMRASDVDTSAWDGPAAMSAAGSADDPAAAYASICAGRRAGDPALGKTWALPHHKHQGDPPNKAGVSAALGRLPSTMDLTNKSAAQAHLEAHQKITSPDSGMNSLTPADIRSLRVEALGGNRRSLPGGAARSEPFRASFRSAPVVFKGKELRQLDGYASITGIEYEMWDMFGPYGETVSQAAFDQTLAAGPDVAFLMNHRGVTMARTTNGTLTLDADPRGLHSQALVNPERGDVRDMLLAIEDGDVTEMSFAFMITAGGWDDDFEHFTIESVDIDRGDVSAVNYGANPYTSIEARSREIMADLMHLPDGAQRAAFARLGARFGGAAILQPGTAPEPVPVLDDNGIPAGASLATVARKAGENGRRPARFWEQMLQT